MKIFGALLVLLEGAVCQEVVQGIVYLSRLVVLMIPGANRGCRYGITSGQAPAQSTRLDSDTAGQPPWLGEPRRSDGNAAMHCAARSIDLAGGSNEMHPQAVHTALWTCYLHPSPVAHTTQLSQHRVLARSRQRVCCVLRTLSAGKGAVIRVDTHSD